ncbi:MAG: phosphoribosyltransferase family protein [Patescibacteria group bacterium]
MFHVTADWARAYENKGALWFHDGIAKRPHALLTSGKHSNGFFNSELVMEDPILLDKAARALLNLLEQNGLRLFEVARVVGPAMGAITLAHDLARHISRERLSGLCLRAYTEKAAEGETKLMVFKKTTIRPLEKVLLVEDVLTTGGSVNLSATAVTDAGGIVLPFVAVLVNRSGLDEVDGKKIVALIDRPMPMWAPEECPLCTQGSEAIRPKGTENWARLNASY